MRFLRRIRNLYRYHEHIVFEATQRCNHACLHCYNAWKNPVEYPMGQLGTAETVAMLARLLDQTRASLISFSGGEPLLRDGIFELIDYVRHRGVDINLICNGSLLDQAAIRRLTPDKISIFEIPLLSVDRDIHDRLSGMPDAFDRATAAMADLKSAHQRVVGVFVATKLNLHTWRRTAELAVALGLDGIMFNRFNPGGEGRNNLHRLQASPQELAEALDVAEDVSKRYGLAISCSIAMPPCLFDTTRYPHLGFGFCAAGTSHAYYTLDPLGNIRPCNHSPTILGNLQQRDFWDIVDGPAARDFAVARPEFCSGCYMESQCQGSCKAAAEVCCGSTRALDPFLAAFCDQAVRPQQA